MIIFKTISPPAPGSGTLFQPILSLHRKGAEVATIYFLPFYNPSSGSVQAFLTLSPGISLPQVHLPAISRGSSTLTHPPGNISTYLYLRGLPLVIEVL